jgi:hypothetical protein
MDLCGQTLTADAAAVREKSKVQLIRRTREPGLTREEAESLWSWGDGVASVDSWTVSKGGWTICYGIIHLPPASQLWLAGEQLCFSNVKFSGVMLCLS